MAGYIDWAKVSGALVVMGVGTPARRCVDGRARYTKPLDAKAERARLAAERKNARAFRALVQ